MPSKIIPGGIDVSGYGDKFQGIKKPCACKCEPFYCKGFERAFCWFVKLLTGGKHV